MSKKIKTVYDADPTAGDDETTNWLVPADDDNNTPVTLDKTQLSDAVATVGAVRDIDERLSAVETSTPLPDPGSTAYWQVTIQPDKLYADVSVWDYTGDAWIITKNNDTPPTDDSVGSTPPTGFTSGLWPSTYNMVTWNTGTLRFYQWDETNGILEKLDTDGNSGILVSPNPETTALTNLFLVSGTDSTTQIQIYWTDPNLLIAGKYTLLYTEVRDDQDNIVAGSLGNIFTDGDTISGLVPDTLYSLRVISYYVGGDWAESETLTKTTTSTSAGTFSILDPRPATGVAVTFDANTISSNVIDAVTAHGMIDGDRYTYDQNGGTAIGTTAAETLDRQTLFVNATTTTTFTVHPTYDDAVDLTNTILLSASAGAETQYMNPATRYEQREDADSGVLEIQVQRLGSTVGGISVDGATYDSDDYPSLLTATDATDFTSITNDTINISDGSAAVQTVTVTLLAPTATTNKVFSYQFMVGTEATGSAVDTTSYTLDRRGDSVLCYIEAGGAGVEGFQQINDGVDDLLVLDVESIYMAWDKQWDNSTAAADALSLWQQTPSTDASGTMYASAGTASVGDATTLGAQALVPVINAPINLTTLGSNTLYVWLYVRNASGTSNDNVHVAFSGNSVATLLGYDAPTAIQSGFAQNSWIWIDTNAGGTRRTITNADISVGAEIFNFAQQNQGFRVKKAVITTNANYDPSLVGAANPFTTTSENIGPPVSDWSTGTDPIDDLGNTDTAIVPVLVTLDPDLLNPLDNERLVDTQLTPITATFTGAINLVNPVIRLFKTTNDVELSGVVSVGGASLNIATFNPSTQLEEGTDYYCTLTADEITNSSGTVVGVDFGSDKTSWNWTTLTVATDFVFLWDGSDRPLGAYSEQDLRDDFNANLYDYTVNAKDGQIVASGDPARGNVLQVKHAANTPFGALKVRLSYDPDNEVIQFPGEIYPDSTDPVYDLTGGAPVSASFTAREADRTATIQKAYDEVWFSSDVKLIPGADGQWQYTTQHKLSGLSTGTPQQATHGIEDFAEGWYGFSLRHQIYGPTAFPNLAGPNGEGWMGVAYYSASRAGKNLVLKPASGTVDDYNHYTISNTIASECYYPTPGKWITMMQHLKLNTANSGLPDLSAKGTTETSYRDNSEWAADGTLANGTLTISIKEEGWPSEIVMLTLTDIWRWTEYMKLDTALAWSFFNNSQLPNQDQWVQVDNFKVSTTPFSPSTPYVSTIEISAAAPTKVVVTLNEDADKDDDWANGFEVYNNTDSVVVPIVSATEASGVITITVNTSLAGKVINVRYTR